jgi:lysophospholipase L1-like esterase
LESFSDKHIKKKEIIHWAVLIICLLAFFEIALRVQQYIGPIYDLKFEDITMEGLSDVVNHKPMRKQFHKLSGRSIYGEYAGYEYTNSHDPYGIRENSLRPKYVKDGSGNRVISILFMGDSFTEGYDDTNTMPQHVWTYLNRMHCVMNVYNAGCSSYSPAIYIPQAKLIIPKVKPDIVVVDIDETDLGDDFIRYRKLIVRDNKGKDIAVRATPIYYEYNYGFLKIRKQPFFIIRLLQTLYHKKIYMPAVKKKYRGDDRKTLSFSWDKSADAKDKYKEEIEFFRSNMRELAETLIYLMGDRRKIIFLYHPHLQHLQADSNGRYWNRFVSSTVREVSEEYDIVFYDSSDDLNKMFMGRPQDFYWPGDMHFNFKGLKIYGTLVAERLLPILKKERYCVK